MSFTQKLGLFISSLLLKDMLPLDGMGYQTVIILSLLKFLNFKIKGVDHAR